MGRRLRQRLMLRRRPYKRQRRPLPEYRPEWQGSAFEKFARNWVKRYYWQVAEHFGSKEDAMQECGMLFAKVIDRYCQTVDNPAWLMSLYKSSVMRAWVFYARKASDERAHIVHEADTQTEYNDEEPIQQQTTHQVDYNEGPLLVAWQEASSELRQVVYTILNAPAELLDMMFRPHVPKAVLARRTRRMAKLRKQAEANVFDELDDMLN